MYRMVPAKTGTATPASAISVAFSPDSFSFSISVSSPAENISRMTPISPMPERKSLCFTSPNTLGPIRIPDMISPATSGICSFRATRLKNLPKTRMMHKSLSISSVSIRCLLTHTLGSFFSGACAAFHHSTRVQAPLKRIEALPLKSRYSCIRFAEQIITPPVPAFTRKARLHLSAARLLWHVLMLLYSITAVLPSLPWLPCFPRRPSPFPEFLPASWLPLPLLQRLSVP